MKFSRLATSIAATLAITASLVAPAANAATVPHLPPEAPAIPRGAVHNVISPYGSEGVCDSFHGVPQTCWQKIPNGQWQKLVTISFGASPVPATVLYPVWEDPASLANVLPPQIRSLLSR